jgi:predicted RNase H-like HicB family nuclease
LPSRRDAVKRRRSLVYDVVLEPAEGGGYTVYVPALRGCVSQGETEEAALDNIRDAILTWHATWQDIAAERKGVMRQVEVTV